MASGNPLPTPQRRPCALSQAGPSCGHFSKPRRMQQVRHLAPKPAVGNPRAVTPQEEQTGSPVVLGRRERDGGADPGAQEPEEGRTCEACLRPSSPSPSAKPAGAKVASDPLKARGAHGPEELGVLPRGRGEARSGAAMRGEVGATCRAERAPGPGELGPLTLKSPSHVSTTAALMSHSCRNTTTGFGEGNKHDETRT